MVHSFLETARWRTIQRAHESALEIRLDVAHTITYGWIGVNGFCGGKERLLKSPAA